jgi:uncharacterized protein YdaU (DUF1376 family)
MKIRRVDWYPADWLEGTAELSYFDAGVYADICNLIYARGGPIDVSLLQARGKCHGNQLNAALIRLERHGKIIRNGSEIDQKRCENELARRRKTIRKGPETTQKRSGNELETSQKTSGNASETGVETNDFNELESHPEQPYVLPINLQSSIIKHQKETRASRAPSNDAFDRWWEGYPEKVGKGAARKAFANAIQKAPVSVLIAGVERYKATKPPDRPWCNPATWLNQERWSDVPAINGSAQSTEFSFLVGPKGPPPTLEELGISIERPD